MKFSKKHIQILLDEGFSCAWLQDGDLMGDLDIEGITTLVFKKSGCAWMLLGPHGMKSPAAITKMSSKFQNIYHPVHSFSSIKEAAKHAKNGKYFRR